MATIEKRVRNGRTTYRVRYRDPAGSQRSKVFARKADAQRFLNETETAKARGTWTDPGPVSATWNDAESAKIARPCWTATTRRVVNERPSRIRSTV